MRLAACSGVAASSTSSHRHEQRPVEVAALEQRQHLVLVDRLAVRVRQELGPVPGAGVQLDLAVAGVVGVEVEQDHEAVVEALAADAPLVHQRGARTRPSRCLGADVSCV